MPHKASVPTRDTSDEDPSEFSEGAKHCAEEACERSVMSTDLLTPAGSKANATARQQAHEQLEQARSTLRELEAQTNGFEDSVARHADKVDAANGDARVTARSRLDAAKGMLRDHQAAIEAQRAEVARLEREVAQLDARAALVDAYAEWTTLTGVRNEAVREAVNAVRSKLQEVVELDAQLEETARVMRAAAGDAGVPAPTVRPPHRLNAGGEAPAPILEALDTALTAERQIRKSQQRASARREQVAA
jgi:chromosome segregation ATPase